MTGTLLVAALSLALTSAPAGSSPGPVVTGGHFELGLELSSIERKAAAAAGVGTPDFGVDFGARVCFWRYLALGAGGGLGGTRDRKSFTETTTGGTRGSSLLLHHWWIAPGVVSPGVDLSVARTNVGLYAGYDGQFGRRSIDNCADCTDQNVHLDGGPFAEGVLALSFNEFFGVLVRYRHKLARGDIVSRVGLDVFLGHAIPPP